MLLSLVTLLLCRCYSHTINGIVLFYKLSGSFPLAIRDYFSFQSIQGCVPLHSQYSQRDELARRFFLSVLSVHFKFACRAEGV